MSDMPSDHGRASRSRVRIEVAHVATVRAACRVVEALQRLGYDCSFDSGFFYKRPGSVARWLPFLPEKAVARLERVLLRRHIPGIDPAKVHCFVLPEFLYLLARFTRLSSGATAKLQAWIGAQFDAHVARRVRRERPDLMIGYDGLCLATFQAARQVNTLTVLHQTTGVVKSACALYREELARHPEFGDSLAPDIPAEVLERYLKEALVADYVIAPSDYVRDTLIAHGVDPTRILIVPFGVDVERFMPAAPREDGPFRILYVGQIGQQKGIKYLLEAFRRLALENAELVLAGPVIGGGAGLSLYRGQFRHLDRVPHAEIHEVYRSADIFAFPSLHEGSSLAIYEALASGLPVIATSNSGSVVRDGEEGFIVPIRDVDALMDRIRRLYENPSLRRAMGRKARTRAEEFTWQRFGDRLGAVVNRILEERRRAGAPRP